MIYNFLPDADWVGSFGGSSGSNNDSAVTSVNTKTGEVILSKSDIGLSNVDNTSDVNKPISNSTKTALDNKADLVNGLIPTSQLPSYVDDVLEYNNDSLFPVVGEQSKIYVSLANNRIYRWTGSVYAEISGSALADAAVKLYTPRTITFAGGASGSYSFDGSKDINVNLNVDLSSTLKTNDSRITGWNTAATNNHTHTNKAVLDATTASYTTEDKTKLTNLVQFRAITLTQDQYDALTIEEKNLDTVLYVIEG